MATLWSWAQDVVTCDLCDKPTQQFCNSCQVSLCDVCIRKHRDQFKSLPHDIVPFLDRKIQLVFSECGDHPGQRCEVNCKDCNKPVCLKCILSGPHKGHDVEELTESYESKRQEIKVDTQEIKTKIGKYQKKEAEVGIQISDAKAKFDDLGKESKKLRQLWHDEVDNIFDKIDSLSHALKDGNLKALTAYQNKIKTLISDLNEMVEKNEKILKSEKLSDVINYKPKLKKWRDFPENALNLKIPSLKTHMDIGKELLVELGDYRASLTQTSLPSPSADVSRLTTRTLELMGEVRVLATIPTRHKPLRGVACVGETEAWICGTDRTITRIDIHGSVMYTVYIEGQNGIRDISVTREGDLIYTKCNIGNQTVNIVRQGRCETLFTATQDWRPEGVCCTRSGDILIHLLGSLLSNCTQNKIVRYQGHRNTQEIYKDEHSKLIFNGGYGALYMSENNNGDICVSDTNTVVIVDRKGRVRYRYDGTAALRKKKFAPRYVVTDALSQIIVTDYKNDCLHILDQNGQFLRCLDNLGAGTWGLSVDSRGRLWVGLYESGTIKVIEY